MERGLENLEILSRRYSISILKLMYKSNKTVKFKELSSIVTAYATLESTMQGLEDAGLVITRKVTKPYKTNFAELTNLGRSVAKKLQQIEDEMNGIKIEDDQTDYETSSAKGNNLA